MSAVAKILSIAEGEVGYREGYSNGRYNNKNKYSPAVPGLEWSDYQPWCATFVSWLAMRADVADLFPRTASCATGTSWFKQRKRFSEYPAVGAQVFFGRNGGTHTGIVYAYDATYAYTYEGNTNDSGSAEGNGVYRKSRLRRADYLHGYGLPAYEGGSFSADPNAAAFGYRHAASAAQPEIAEPAKPPAAKPPAAKVSVDLSRLVSAAKTDPGARQGHQTYASGTRVVESALRAEGLLAAKYAGDGSFGSVTVKAYAAWQRKLGYSGRDADGMPGSASLKALGRKHGFEVRA